MRVQLFGEQVGVVDRVGADVRAGQHDRGTELDRHIQLREHPTQRLSEAVRRGAGRVAHRLEQVDREAEICAPRRDLAR